MQQIELRAGLAWPNDHSGSVLGFVGHSGEAAFWGSGCFFSVVHLALPVSHLQPTYIYVSGLASHLTAYLCSAPAVSLCVS